MYTELLSYLLQANISISLFFLVYWILLRKLTFYTLNRYFLQFGIFFSIVFPFLNVDALVGHHGEMVISQRIQESVPLLIEFRSPEPSAFQTFAHYGFFVGLILFAIYLLIKIFSLYKLHRSSRPDVWFVFTYRRVFANIQPFTFWKTIYLNPEGSDEDVLLDVFRHEQVHVDQLHSFDVMLAELAQVIYWFNPFVWLYRGAVHENLEYITDREVLRAGIDRTKYQIHLLNSYRTNSLSSEPRPAVEYSANSITNHFNFHYLKRRIMMMNKKNSSKYQLGRYLLAIPAVTAITMIVTLAFHQTQAKSTLALDVALTKSTTDEVSNAMNKTESLNEPVGSAPSPSTTSAAVAKKIAIDSEQLEKLDSTKITIGLRGVSADKEPLYILDGREISKSEMEALSPNQIHSITVLKDKSAVDVYGEKGKDGVIVIALKKSSDAGGGKSEVALGNDDISEDAIGRIKGVAVHTKDTALLINNLPKFEIRGVSGVGSGEKKPLVLINGVKGDMDKLDPAKIRSVTVLKNDGTLIEKYGAEAKNGVVLIEAVD